MRRLSFLFAVSSLTLLANDVPVSDSGSQMQPLAQLKALPPAFTFNPHALNVPKLLAAPPKGLEAQVRVSAGGCVVPMPTINGDSRIDSKSLLQAPKTGIEPMPEIRGEVCKSGR